MGVLDTIKKNTKGLIGEVKIDSILNRFAHEQCFTVRDLLLVRDGKSTQIDNILFTYRKIYIIESKNYSGWIYGSEMGKSWTQTYNHYGKITRSSFYNPLTQNFGHIKFFSKFFDLQLTSFINIVVFSNDAELKNISTEKHYNFVINVKDLSYLINHIEESNEILFDWEDLERFNDALLYLNTKDSKSKKNHKKYVKSIVDRGKNESGE